MKRANMYNAPTVELIEVVLERGFEPSGFGDISEGNDGGKL